MIHREEGWDSHLSGSTKFYPGDLKCKQERPKSSELDCIHFRTLARCTEFCCPSPQSCPISSTFNQCLFLLLCHQHIWSFIQNLDLYLHQCNCRWWQDLRKIKLTPPHKIGALVCRPTLEIRTSCLWQTADSKVPDVLLPEIPWKRGHKIA